MVMDVMANWTTKDKFTNKMNCFLWETDGIKSTKPTNLYLSMDISM